MALERGYGGGSAFRAGMMTTFPRRSKSAYFDVRFDSVNIDSAPQSRGTDSRRLSMTREDRMTMVMKA